MRHLLYVFLGLLSTTASALDRITEQDIHLFLDDQMTYTIQKNIDGLMSLYAESYQVESNNGKQYTSRNELKKNYTNNFLLAKLILNSIDLKESRIESDGQKAWIRTHALTRYLIELPTKKDVLSQQIDLESEIAIKNGKLVYLSSKQK